MALQPNSFAGQDRLQPGARGEIFQANLPGYRNQGDRLNRTNAKLNTNAHDVPNIKYEFDNRLPVLFRYGYAYGYNQMTMPKGRLVAVDPYMDKVDFDTRKQHNVLTLANGGVPVRLRKESDVYGDYSAKPSAIVDPIKQGQSVVNPEKEWIPTVGMQEAYTELTFRPFRNKGPLAQLKDAGMELDVNTAKVVDANGTIRNDYRVGNVPIGIISRNEYTRDDDAFNGIAPGAILTDAMVEMPWFSYKDKAEMNPWGSAYGGLFPGALVKSDENGRFVVSPLSFIEAEVSTMGMQEYELERQQVVGQVYAVNTELVPEGAAKWVTWALEDRLNFEEFNPSVHAQNNRRGEDAVSRTPYHSTGEYPGYPFDKNIGNHDLHMLASTARGYDHRLNQEYQLDNLGIPGLTDGKNVVVRQYDPETVGTIFNANADKYQNMYLRTAEVDLEKNSLEIKIGNEAFVKCTEGAIIKVTDKDFVKINYADELQGMIVLEFVDAELANNIIPVQGLQVQVRYRKRGLSGVPTFLDWDGVVGSVKILLTK